MLEKLRNNTIEKLCYYEIDKIIKEVGRPEKIGGIYEKLYEAYYNILMIYQTGKTVEEFRRSYEISLEIKRLKKKLKNNTNPFIAIMGE